MRSFRPLALGGHMDFYTILAVVGVMAVVGGVFTFRRRKSPVATEKAIVIPAVAGVPIDRPPVKARHAVVCTPRAVSLATRKHPRTLTARQAVARMQATRRMRGQNHRTGA